MKIVREAGKKTQMKTEEADLHREQSELYKLRKPSTGRPGTSDFLIVRQQNPVTQRGRGWEERKAVPCSEGMKLHCLDSLPGSKKTSSSPQLMGQPAAVLEGPKHCSPRAWVAALQIMTSLNVEAGFSYLPFFHQQVV